VKLVLNYSVQKYEIFLTTKKKKKKKKKKEKQEKG